MSDRDLSRRPTVCLDLDGVLNLYDGWRGEDHFADPREGAQEFLQALSLRHRVVILTTRDSGKVWTWLRRHRLSLDVDEVTDRKPPAVVYVDDRAVCFDGSFDGLAERIAAFKAHWE